MEYSSNSFREPAATGNVRCPQIFVCVWWK